MARGISVNIRIRPDLLNKAKAEADRLGLSLSAFLTMCLASYIDGVKFERDRTEAEPPKVRYMGRE